MNGATLDALLQQGLGLRLAGDMAGAERLYRAALEREPKHADTLYLLAELLECAGDYASACALLEHAIDIAPERPLFHLALANVLAASGRREAASMSYQAALRLDPGLAEAHLNLGAVQYALGSMEQAEASFSAALQLNPELAEAHNNLGGICMARNQPGEAEKHFRQALSLSPQQADAHANLASLLRNRGDLREARSHFEQAYAIAPSDCMPIKMALMLPPVYGSIDEMCAERSRLQSDLARLEQMPLVPCNPLRGGGGNNFYLVYQGQDDKEIQQRLARLYRRIYQPMQHSVERLPVAGRRLKLGFVSSFLRAHTIGDLNRGIIANLDRDRFEVSVFSIGEFHDHVAAFIRQHADHYHALPSRDLPELENFIARQQMDVLLYTDIGMEPVSYFLAFSRLAPVQCVTWGHPVTTGIDSIDYFISSEHQETPESQQYYSEKLVRLKNIPAYYYPPDLPQHGKDLQGFGLPEGRNIYLCPQSLFKLHPDFDALLADILRSDPDGLLVLMEGHWPQWTAQLKQRFGRSMPDVADRVVFLQRLAYADYMRLMQLCHVMLDPLHFGGGKTTLDALSMGVPVVTLPGRFMRGRATYASYRQMVLTTDCIAGSRSDYVAKALAIGMNRDYRAMLGGQIRERSHLLWQDNSMLRELEEFLLQAVAAG